MKTVLTFLVKMEVIMERVPFLCRLRSIATHRDHFVRRLSHFPKLCFAGDTCIPRNAATIFFGGGGGVNVPDRGFINNECNFCLFQIHDAETSYQIVP